MDVQLAIMRDQIRGMDDAYARLELERIAMEAEKAVHMLPETHHGRFLAVLKVARG